jgi:chromosomal replication initiator protein
VTDAPEKTAAGKRSRESTRRRRESPAPSGTAIADGPAEQSSLNSAFSFGTLVEGQFNRLAAVAARAAAENPGAVYNPLFIHADVGLGKSHLLQSMARLLMDRRPDLRTRYLTCEAFASMYQDALQRDSLPDLRRVIRGMDVLLMDDAQYLVGRPALQEEILYTFDARLNAGGQMAFAADAAPSMLGVMERLASRLKSGLTVEIIAADRASLRAVVRKKAEAMGRALPDDVLDIIVGDAANVREVESALTRVAGYAAMMKTPISAALAAEVLKRRSVAARPVAVEAVQVVVAKYYGLTVDDIRSRMRTRLLTFPRQVAIFLARELTDQPLEALGGLFGDRDHSTVQHSINRIARECRKSKELESTLHELRRLIKSNR